MHRQYKIILHCQPIINFLPRHCIFFLFWKKTKFINQTKLQKTSLFGLAELCDIFVETLSLVVSIKLIYTEMSF
jgi:hypothetical protein